MDPADIAHMRAALSLAARALGVAWPNPAAQGPARPWWAHGSSVT